MWLSLGALLIGRHVRARRADCLTDDRTNNTHQLMMTLNTTMKYARADRNLKRQALAQVVPEALAPPAEGGARVDVNVVEWLRRL
jgi:hypothetical protein